MKAFFITMLLVLVSACSTLTPEEREYNLVETQAQYARCLAVYEAAGIIWVKTDRGPRVRPSALDMRTEMFDNLCFADRG